MHMHSHRHIHACTHTHACMHKCMGERGAGKIHTRESMRARDRIPVCRHTHTLLPSHHRFLEPEHPAHPQRNLCFSGSAVPTSEGLQNRGMSLLLQGKGFRPSCRYSRPCRSKRSTQEAQEGALEGEEMGMIQTGGARGRVSGGSGWQC